jgi:molybdenum cofactor biosynthesis enzyme MoaA
MRCEHCFYKAEIDSKSNKDELSLEEIQKFSRSLKGKIRGISLTGGEPFVRKDLSDIVKSLHVDGGIKHISIATNGFYCDRVVNFIEHTVASFPSLSIDIQISLDGMEKTRDEVRKIPGSFNKAIFTLSNLESKAKQYPNFRVIINTVVHKYNSNEFTAFYEYFTKNHTANFIWHFARKDEIDVKAIKKK